MIDHDNSPELAPTSSASPSDSPLLLNSTRRGAAARARPRWRWLGALAAVVAATGCVGSPDLDGAANELVEVERGTDPLDWLGSAWELAPAGCEDRLKGEERFELASADHGLVAAVDSEDEVVCVDTLGSVKEELVEEGRADDADELEDQFWVALGVGTLLNAERLLAADPSPQPSSEELNGQSSDDGGSRGGDPSPQPSSQPMER